MSDDGTPYCLNDHRHGPAVGEALYGNGRGRRDRGPAVRACQTCWHIHSAADVRAVDRFNPAGAAGYRALHDGAPLRRTRYQADKDACLYRLARKDAQP